MEHKSKRSRNGNLIGNLSARQRRRGAVVPAASGPLVHRGWPVRVLVEKIPEHPHDDDEQERRHADEDDHDIFGLFFGDAPLPALVFPLVEVFSAGADAV